MITIYGASDDLIEIDGDISEEFTLHNDAPEVGDLLAISDGTILRIAFTPHGIWRIMPLVRGPGLLTIEQAAEGEESNYSDRATLSGAVWVVQGIAQARCL
ncbi:hypothetical protein [Micromonospora peucetia]|uniref:Uncharacterized protein n=1 Tax=Micromonospora peucetia TaxID=47871 RepID=A0ABZ1EJX6_9ACTN|nr:hypothetical protein [Micromonospora peucetia]WSA34534.1 hypothetical protein OIE14_11070 [Micromonospora peucetia]